MSTNNWLANTTNGLIEDQASNLDTKNCIYAIFKNILFSQNIIKNQCNLCCWPNLMNFEKKNGTPSIN